MTPQGPARNTRAAVGEDVTALFEKINELLSTPEGDIAQIERTLTDGYASALSLEAEHLRLRKRIGEVAATLERGDAMKKTKELSSLAKRLEASDGALARLRGELANLRRHADAVRAATA
jgi:chromosome segregation ATPase